MFNQVSQAGGLGGLGTTGLGGGSLFSRGGVTGLGTSLQSSQAGSLFNKPLGTMSTLGGGLSLGMGQTGLGGGGLSLGGGMSNVYTLSFSGETGCCAKKLRTFHHSTFSLHVALSLTYIYGKDVPFIFYSCRYWWQYQLRQWSGHWTGYGWPVRSWSW